MEVTKTLDVPVSICLYYFPGTRGQGKVDA